MEILRVEHLSRIYGKGETEVRALDDVSFTMEKGEMTAVMGRSGSGKIHTASSCRRSGSSGWREDFCGRAGSVSPLPEGDGDFSPEKGGADLSVL